MNMPSNKAVILLSGGLDSATVLACAQAQGYQCYTLAFDYGQRHRAELQAAERLAAAAHVMEHQVVRLDLQGLSRSALTDSNQKIPDAGQVGQQIPTTYVPARNTLFLSLALGWAETLVARTIGIGVNSVDYSGYPDCRPTFIEQFQRLANVATKEGLEGRPFNIWAPLQNHSKAQIIQLGHELGVDYSLTVSCYQADNEGRACGRCESCYLRRQGFVQAGLADVTRYAFN